MLADRLGAGGQQEPTTQQLADALDPERGMPLFEFDDLLSDRLRQSGLARPGRCLLQAGFAELLIQFDPTAQATLRHTHLGADVPQFEPFLQPQTNGFEFGFLRIAPPQILSAATPPRGGGVLSSLLLYYTFFIHVNTPLLIGVSTTFSLNLVS
jgi:hypothetical protein